VSKVRVSRSLHLIGAVGASRTETFRGREYLVVPVVALVEGVIWPVNAETPEYVPSEAYSIAPEGWNGRPCFPGHPTRGGTQVLGNTPEILEAEQFGIVFNAGLTDEKLTMEAWLSKDDATVVGDSALDIYNRAEAGEPVEISVGVIVLMEEVKGTYNDVEYDGKWVEVFPDHLALLPDGDIGACSISMGCGVRTATVHRMAAKGYELVTGKENPLPEKKDDDKIKPRSLGERFAGMVKRMLSPTGWSDTEVRSELLEALEEKEPRMKYNGWVIDVYDNEGLVVYCMYDEEYDMDLYVRDFKWDGKTAVIGDLFAEVEAHTVYEVEDDENQANEVLITQLRAAQKITAQPKAASCGCGGKTTTAAQIDKPSIEGETMQTKDERIAAMIAASGGKYTEADKPWLATVPEAHLATLEAANKPSDKPGEGPKPNTGGTTDIPTKPSVPDPDKVVPESQEQFLARNPDLKKIVDRAAAQEKTRRMYLVGVLKDLQKEYNETELMAMPIEDLERTARLMSATTAADAVDFSGIATPRELASKETEGAPKPPSLNEAVRAASGKSTKQ
jgi:hypothetical protein